jgi:NADH-quinone oxidoreductase subunit A
MLFDFAAILVFLLFGALFVVGNIILSRIIQARNPHPGKVSTYECGELPVGESWIQFNIRFYVVALVFLIFEVEIVFLFPWAVVFESLGTFAFVEMMIFVFILLVGLAYVWAKGDLEWDKPQAVPDTRMTYPSQKVLSEEMAS